MSETDGQTRQRHRVGWTPSPTSFNRVCYALSLVWIVGVLVPFALAKNPTPDFGQLYMSGVIASQGQWEALYPEPTPGARRNAGFIKGSTPKPVYEALRKQLGVPDVNRFIYTPPSALLCWPLSAMDYRLARVLFMLFIAGCVWVTAWSAASLHEWLWGMPTKVSGLLCLVISVSPWMVNGMRCQNISLVIGAAIALAAQGLMFRSRWAVVAGVTFGGVFKATTLPLALLLLATRRWRTLLGCVLLTMVLVGVSLMIMGVEPFRVYFEKIVPTLRFSSDLPGNYAVAGVLRRVWPGFDEVGRSGVALQIVGAGCLLTLTALAWARRHAIEASPPALYASAAALTIVGMVFGPLFWSHYGALMAVFWGYLAWEIRQGGRRVVWIAAAFVLIETPLADLPMRGLPIPEPLLSHALWGYLIILGIAVQRVWTTPAPDVCRTTAQF